MSHTFTATPDAVISGGAVQITEPDDGDLANVASQNTPDEKLAKLIKKLVNQSLLGGLSPSILDANSTNGLIFASEADSSGTPVKVRIYSIGAGVARKLWITSNALWDGALWNRDSATIGAIGMQLTPFASNDDDDSHIYCVVFDATAAATWADSAWTSEKLKTNTGGVANAGNGPIKMAAAIVVGSGGSAPAFQNSWVNQDTAIYKNLHFWKDPFGMVHVQGFVKSGSGLTVFTLPAGYRPSDDLAFPATYNNSGPQPTWVFVAPTGEVTVNNGTDQVAISIHFR